MKSTKLLLILMVVLSFWSCKDEDEIIGTWDVTVFEYGGSSTTSVQGEDYTTNFEGTGRDMSLTVEFKGDGTYTSQGSYTIDLDYDFAGQMFSQPVTLTDYFGTGTYVVDGTTITFTDDQSNEESTGTITKLAGDDLELNFKKTETSIAQGTTSSYTIDGDYVFVRQ